MSDWSGNWIISAGQMVSAVALLDFDVESTRKRLYLTQFPQLLNHKKTRKNV